MPKPFPNRTYSIASSEESVGKSGKQRVAQTVVVALIGCWSENNSSNRAVGMWEARGLRFPRKREIPFLGLGIFLFRHFHRLLAGATLERPSRNLRNLLQVDSKDRCCSSESL